VADENDQRASMLVVDGADDHGAPKSADLFGSAPRGGVVGKSEGVRDVSRAASVYPGFAQSGDGRAIARPSLLRVVVLNVIPAHLRTATG
jgi:hypothetical protein